MARNEIPVGALKLSKSSLTELRRAIRREEKQKGIRTTLFSVAFGPKPGTIWFGPDSPNPAHLYVVSEVGTDPNDDRQYVLFEDESQKSMLLDGFVELVTSGMLVLVGLKQESTARTLSLGTYEDYN